MYEYSKNSDQLIKKRIRAKKLHRKTKNVTIVRLQCSKNE